MTTPSVTVDEQYDQHLGPLYSWMIGDWDAALQRQRDFFRKRVIQPGATARALDLGAGPGLQSLALAELGFSVPAVDNCQVLLDELNARARGSNFNKVNTTAADLREFRAHYAGQADVIVCMGDTLTHLPSLDAVVRLIRDAAATLAPGGTLVLTFRDYVSRELHGAERFIHVRNDDRRILTCFLEFEPLFVRVHDLVHEHTDGQWRFTSSCYLKLRLAREWVTNQVREAGLRMVQDTLENGSVCIVARQPRKGSLR